MNVNKNGKKIGLLILVIFSLSLVLNSNNVSAGWNWVEWDGYVYNDSGYVQANVTVRLKYGSTTLDSDVTTSSGYYFIRAYIDNSKRYTLKASKANWTSQQYDNLIGRPEGSGPWRYYFNLYYVETWAVIVGIETYSVSATWPNLVSPEKDADDWFKHLTNSSGLNFDYVKQYEDEEAGIIGKANENNIKSELNYVASNADGGDIIAFIFSGHGDNVGTYSLCMWDADNGQGGEDGFLNTTELANIFDNCKAERIFFFFDSCHSYGMRNGLDELSIKNHIFLTAAAGDAQIAYEDDDHNNGCWTYCFLEYTWQGPERQYGQPIGFNYYIDANIPDILVEAYTIHNLYANQNPPPYYYNPATQPQIWNPTSKDFYLSKYMINLQ